MSNLKTLVLLSLVAGLTAPVLASEKIELGDVKNPDEYNSPVGELSDINLQGDEIGNPFIVPSIPFSLDVPDISIFNNVYTSTNYTSLRAGDDVVFKFTPTETSANNTIDLSASYAFNAVDTYMHVFKNTINAAGYVTKDDDSGDGATSKITGLTFLAGNDYYIIIETYSATTSPWHIAGTISGPCVDPGYPIGFTSAFELEPACANSNGTCLTAEGLSENMPLGGLTKADASVKDTDYYTFTLTQPMDVSLTVAANCVAMVGTLYSGTCASPVSRASISAGAYAVATSAVVPYLAAGTYFVKVEPSVTTGFACAANYTYGVLLNSTTPPPPPTNVDAAHATPLTLGSCVTGNTTHPVYTDTYHFYTNEYLTHLYCPWTNTSTSVGLSADAWYTIELPCEAQYTFTLEPPANFTTFDTVLGVFDVDGNLVAANDDNGAGGLWSRVLCCTMPGGTYTIAVDGYNTARGAFNLCVTQCTECPVDADDQPVQFGLGQNYPNPFNPATTINFTLGETGTASLKVFDLNGREVATLLNGSLERGAHSVTFDGSHLASGVYFYTLTANGSVETKKMVLMK
ncbi:MAG: T9SS type A sorting domain-containing protein [Candidatus Delongbacteria bacterium]